MKILDQIVFEMENLEDLYEPAGKVESNETVIGQCSEDDKKLWTLYKHYHARFKELVASDVAKNIGASVQKALEDGATVENGLTLGMVKLPFGPEQQELGFKSRLLYDLFWYNLRSGHLTWSDNIAIREKWQIVSYEERV